MDYYIYSDMSLDIDLEMAHQYDIRFVPMNYMLGDETFLCDAPQTNEEMHLFYEKLRKNIPTKTSQITPAYYEEFFGALVEQGIALIYLCLSSGLSNTYSSACLSVQNLKEKYGDKVQIEIVDTLSGTGGMGLLAEKAGENRKKGMSLAENAAWLRKNAVLIEHWFKVQDLMYLQRGGRVSKTTAIVGTALNIKPLLVISPDGTLAAKEKKRGTKAALKAMVEHFNQTYDPAFGNIVYISCSDCMQDADDVEQQLLQTHPDLKVRKTMLSPIIGAHTGPDMLALIYFSTGRV